MTKSKTYPDLIRKVAESCVWDPAEEGLEPHVDVKFDGINNATSEFLKRSGLQGWCRDQGMTPLQMAENHPTMNNTMLVTGVASISEYKAASKKSDKEIKWFDIISQDEPKKAFERARKASSILTEAVKKPASLDLGSLGTISLPEDGKLVAVNALLSDSGVPSLEDIFSEVALVADSRSSLLHEAETAQAEVKKVQSDLDRMRQVVSELSNNQMSNVNVEYTNERGEIPDGKVVTRKASEMFPIELETDFEIPTWEWDGDHPDVPAKDPNYIFRAKHLQRTLYALITNQREYIQGHTGSGKTTLIEQVAAHLNWPFMRINFDSEITRMDLIGRDTLVSDDDGKVTSVFEDGMLPTAMSGPYICCFDELDFVRPDVAYVMQAALEGSGLRITEDGDRVVKPHPMFRMFGTGNTVGQGDEHGMYQGARPQSLAFLDRFTIWDRVEYLSAEEREQLVSRKFPALSEEDKKQVLQYTTEHLEAFTQGKVIQPFSPRGMLAVCQATISLGSVKTALSMTVLDRANVEDRATLKGLVDRVS